MPADRIRECAEELELYHARAEIAHKQSDITALESRLARVTEAAQEARAALYGARESLGRIGNIQHAIDLCDATLADDAPGEMLAAKDAK